MIKICLIKFLQDYEFESLNSIAMLNKIIPKQGSSLHGIESILAKRRLVCETFFVDIDAESPWTIYYFGTNRTHTILV